MSDQNKLASDLRDACNSSDLKQVKVLLLCGANPCHVIKGEGWAPIHSAAANKDDCTDHLEAIISSGSISNIEVVAGTENVTPLLNTCSYGNVKCVKLLLANGANVTAKTTIKYGVIHYAVQSSKLEMVKECLTWNGVDINERGNNNRTALIHACQQGCVDIVRVLLSVGADVTLKDGKGNTALWYAKDNKEITDVFLKYQSKLTKPESGASALPTAFGTLSVSSGTSSNQNESSVANIIKRTFPNFTQGMIKSVLTAIEETGYDFDADDLKDLILLQEKDLEKVLKPLQTRKLLIAFKNESELQGRVVVNF